MSCRTEVRIVCEENAKRSLSAAHQHNGHVTLWKNISRCQIVRSSRASYFYSPEGDTCRSSAAAGARRSTLTFRLPDKDIVGAHRSWIKSHHSCRKVVCSVGNRLGWCENDGDVQGNDGATRRERLERREQVLWMVRRRPGGIRRRRRQEGCPGLLTYKMT